MSLPCFPRKDGSAPTLAQKTRRGAWGSLCCAAVSVAGALVATAGHAALSSYVSGKLRAAFVLSSPSAAQYAPWLDSTDPNAGSVISTYYVNNLTNPMEVALGLEAPNLVEIGPLRYQYRNRKLNPRWERDGEVLTYTTYRHYFPADDFTAELESVVFTVPNLILLAALHNPELSGFVPILYPDTLVTGALFTRRSIRDMLWGYLDTQFNRTFPGLQANDTSPEYALATHSQSRLYTGLTTGSKGMEMMEWDGAPAMTCCDNGPVGEAGSGGNCAPLWPGWDAASVRGSFGDQFHMGIDPSETLHLGSYDFGMYRHWPFQCGGVGDGPGPGWLSDGSPLTASIGGCNTYEVQGISLLRFDMPSWILGNVTSSPDEGLGYGIIGPSGLMNQSACEQDAPIFISLPHFLFGSSSLTDAVTGFSPADVEQHGSYFGVEPVTGLVLDLHVRVGINTRIEPITVSTILGPQKYFADVRPLYYPICWGGQESIATPAQAETFKAGVYVGLRVLAAVRWGGVAVAIVGLLACLALHVGVVVAGIKGLDGGGAEGGFSGSGRGGDSSYEALHPLMGMGMIN